MSKPAAAAGRPYHTVYRYRGSELTRKDWPTNTTTPPQALLWAPVSMAQYNYRKNYTRTFTLTFPGRVAGGKGNAADATTGVPLSFLASVYQVDSTLGPFNIQEAAPVVVTIEDK